MPKMENTFAWSRLTKEEIPKPDLSNYYTKPETNALLERKQDKIINGDDCGINSNNQVYILPKLKEKINLVDTKQDKLISNNNIIVNPDNTLSIKPSVFDGYATTQWVNDNFVLYTRLQQQYYDKQEIDRKFQEQSSNPILYPTSPTTEIINLPAGRRLLKFQMTIPNDIHNDWWNNIPQEIKEVNNINNIEYMTYNVIDSNGLTGIVPDGVPLIGTYQHRLLIKGWGSTVDYWRGKNIRFSIIVS